MDRKTDFQKSDETNELILEAAVHVFAEKGYKDSTMQLIAKRAGLVTSGIYYYYGGKKELFEAAADYLISHLESSVFERWRAVIEDGGLDAFIEDAIEAVEEERTYVKLLSNLAAESEKLDSSCRERLAGVFLRVEEGIKKHMPDEDTARRAKELAQDMYAYIFLYAITGGKEVFDRQMRQSRERYKRMMKEAPLPNR